MIDPSNPHNHVCPAGTLYPGINHPEQCSNPLCWRVRMRMEFRALEEHIIFLNNLRALRGGL